MPILDIGGRKVTVDDAFLKLPPDEQNAAVEEIAASFGKPAERSAVSGLTDAARQGGANVVSGIGETIKQYTGATETGEALKKVGASIAPKDYKESPIVDEQGVHVSNVPRAVVEQAPGMAAAITAARLMRGPMWARALAGAGAYAGMGLGNSAKERAAEVSGNPNAEPTTTDKAVAAATMVPEAALGAVGVSRFLPKGTPGNLTGALKRFATTAATETGVGAAQNVTRQAGRTVGTEDGISIDPTEVANAAATSGVTGSALAVPRGIADSRVGSQMKKFGGENAEASSAVANRITTAAEGDLKNVKTAFQAVKAVGDDLKTEIGGVKLPEGASQEAKNAVARAAKGDELTETDLKHITSAGDAQLSTLARQATVLSKLKKQGDFRPEKEKFAGGIASKMERGVNILRNPTGAAVGTALGMSGLGAGMMGGMLTYAPATVGAVGAAYGGARILDKMTGARSPTNRFVKQFADGSTPVRADAPQPAPVNRPQGSVPSIKPLPTPWGAPAPEARAENVKSNLLVHEGMAKIAKQLAGQKKAKMTADAMPLLQQLADTAEIPAAPAAPPAPPPTSVPKDVMTNTRALVRGLQATQNLKQKTIGNAQAEDVARTSPMVQDVGGLAAISNPDAGKRMSQLVSASKALKTLTAVPEEEAAPASAPKPAKVKKSNGKVDVDAAPTSHVNGNGNGGAGEPFSLPMSPYAHLSPDQAAEARVQDMSKGGVPPYLADRYKVGIIKRITAIREAASHVGREAPDINAERIAGAFEGVSSRTDAKTLRETLKAKFPSAAEALDLHWSDAHIKKIWRK